VYLIIKRIIDLFTALFLLIITAIPMFLISLVIKLFDNGPIIFKQERVGKNKEKFICYKFRTMSVDAPHELSTKEFTDSYKYITPIGRLLRRSSLDELPQLFNVLIGNMSIVGPRPLISSEREIHRMRSEYGVYDLKPGITGLAQVCGRDSLSDERKAECDAIYAENISFLVDVKIFMATLLKVIKKEDIYGATLWCLTICFFSSIIII
jgi:O-antigen biosynthesis protein WbqP